MRWKSKTWLGGMALLTVLTMSACTGKTSETGTATPAVTQEGANSTPKPVDVQSATTLKDGFANDFRVGLCTTAGGLSDENLLPFLKKHCNSVTMENAMKPESLLDWKGSEESEDGMPAINEAELEKNLKAAKEAGIPLRGHCLVWHSQTPEWFFCEDYEPSKGRVDKETMQKRMEVYIQKVLTFCEGKYPGVVYAWDVVNEAMGDDGWYRTESGWYETYGDESYIKDAFRFSRKYAGKDVKLFYNDYNEYTPQKRDLIISLLKEMKEEDIVDGVGMQSHWDMEYPTATMLQSALEMYGEIDGLEIQLTEIDMHNTDDSEEGLRAQAERYKEFFDIIVKADREGKANITNVTFWGVTDGASWLSGFKGETSYPLLFDDEYKEKPCYASILEVAKGQ